MCGGLKRAVFASSIFAISILSTVQIYAYPDSVTIDSELNAIGISAQPMDKNAKKIFFESGIYNIEVQIT